MFEVKINGESVKLVGTRMEALDYVANHAKRSNLTLTYPAHESEWSYTRFVLSESDPVAEGEIIHISGNKYFD